MNTTQAPSRPAQDRVAWSRVGKIAAYVAAGALFTQSGLYLLDVTGLLQPSVTFRATAAGRQADLATFYTAFHERQHRLWWNIAVRDTLGPLAYLALVVLALAVQRVLGRRDPRVVLMVLFMSIGALGAAVADIVFMSQLATWRGGGFAPTPDIVAFGRASEVLLHAVDFLLHAGFVVLAAGFVCFGSVLRTASATVARLAVLAQILAAALLAVVVFRLLGLGTAHDVATALTGLVLGPALAVLVGRTMPQLAAASADVGQGPLL